MAEDKDKKAEDKLRRSLKGEAASTQPSGKTKPALKKILDKGKKKDK